MGGYACSDDDGVSDSDSSPIVQVANSQHIISTIPNDVTWTLDTILWDNMVHPFGKDYDGITLSLNGEQGITLTRGNEMISGNYHVIDNGVIKVYGLSSFEGLAFNHLNLPNTSGEVSDPLNGLTTGEGWRIRLDSARMYMFWSSTDGKMRIVFSRN